MVDIYEKILYLVKWGFTREEAWWIPIPELDIHVRNINKYYKEKYDAENAAAGEPPGGSDMPRFAGNSLPSGVF